MFAFFGANNGCKQFGVVNGRSKMRLRVDADTHIHIYIVCVPTNIKQRRRSTNIFYEQKIKTFHVKIKLIFVSKNIIKKFVFKVAIFFELQI